MLCIASMVLGVAYAAADVVEDMLLALVFGSRDRRPRAAALAPWATRIKMLCLVGSITGGMLFAALSLLGRAMPPKMPTRF